MAGPTLELRRHIKNHAPLSDCEVELLRHAANGIAIRRSGGRFLLGAAPRGSCIRRLLQAGYLSRTSKRTDVGCSGYSRLEFSSLEGLSGGKNAPLADYGGIRSS